MPIEHSIRSTLQCGEGEIGFSCPSCKNGIEADEVFPLIEESQNPFKPRPEVECAACHGRAIVSDLVVEGGAFANVVLRLWNWPPLKPAFVAKAAEVRGAEVTVLEERV